MIRLPDDDTLYDALTARSDAYEGRVFVGVTSTGIFCRFTCSARLPKRENCRFFASAAACLEAGFRPCRRCRPLAPGPAADPLIAPLLAALEAAPDKVWREHDVAALGVDPRQARRAFRRAYGLTFLEMARLMRLRRGFTVLGQTGSVTQAQLEAGFMSPSAFRTAFARLMGAPPAAFNARSGSARSSGLLADWLDTPLGGMVAVGDDRALHLLDFADRKTLPQALRRVRAACGGEIGIGRAAAVAQAAEALEAFFAGRSADFDVALVMHGTPFQKRVWTALREIPPGETRSYAALARAIGQPTATRAVARANGANALALVVPCHRVIGADGSLTGYGGGLWRKRWLLDLEQRLRAA